MCEVASRLNQRKGFLGRGALFAWGFLGRHRLSSALSEVLDGGDQLHRPPGQNWLGGSCHSSSWTPPEVLLTLCLESEDGET